MSLYLNCEEGDVGRIKRVIPTIEAAFINATLSENER